MPLGDRMVCDEKPKWLIIFLRFAIGIRHFQSLKSEMGIYCVDSITGVFQLGIQWMYFEPMARDSFVSTRSHWFQIATARPSFWFEPIS